MEITYKVFFVFGTHLILTIDKNYGHEFFSQDRQGGIQKPRVSQGRGGVRPKNHAGVGGSGKKPRGFLMPQNLRKIYVI